MSAEVEKISCLVTGGAGFIGSHLVDALLARGYRVSCLDNFVTGRRENLKSAMQHPDFTLIEGDIRDRELCCKVFSGANWVFHQAALGSVPRSIADPVESASVNVEGFVNVLFAAVQSGVKSFVYASSSSVYGSEEKLPKQEELIGRPLSPYAATKYADEIFAGNFAEVYGMKITGLRYFNVFGPRQDPNGAYAAVIPRFVTALLKKTAPVINGDGSNSRDFTYVANVVNANLLAAGRDGSGHRVYNVAAGSRISLNRLFETLKKKLSEVDPAIAAVEALHGPDRVGDIPHSFADISRAEQELGYRAEYDFESGADEMLKYYVKEYYRK